MDNKRKVHYHLVVDGKYNSAVFASAALVSEFIAEYGAQFKGVKRIMGCDCAAG